MILGNFYNVSKKTLETFKELIADKKLPVTLEIEGDTVQVIADINSDFECLAQKYDGVTEYFTNESVSFKDDCTCEHCNSARSRKKLFLIRVNGITKQVGSTCVDEYTGLKYLKELNKILKVKETIQALFEESVSAPKYVGLDEVLSKVASYLAKNGYDKDDIKYNFFDIKVDKDISKKYDLGDLSKYFVNKAKQDPYNNFLKTCKDIVNKDYIHVKFLGYAIWMVHDYIVNKDGSNNGKNEYYGNVGDKVNGENLIIKDVKVIPVEGYAYNSVSFIYIITIANTGYTFVYKGDNDNIKIGGVLKAFTVKQHKEYNGTKQTVILRPKF